MAVVKVKPQDIGILYKNIDLEKLLKTYEERLSDLRRCL